jgi:hypothetical protein
MDSHFTILKFTSLLRTLKQLFGVTLQESGADVVLHANAKGLRISGGKQIAVKVMARPGYHSIMCTLVASRSMSPRRQRRSRSAAEEVSLPELLLPLSATQDVGQDTSEVITGALQLHSINPDAKMMARATTLHVRLFILNASENNMLQQTSQTQGMLILKSFCAQPLKSLKASAPKQVFMGLAGHVSASCRLQFSRTIPCQSDTVRNVAFAEWGIWKVSCTEFRSDGKTFLDT